MWKIDLANRDSTGPLLRMQKNTGFPVDTEVEGMPTGWCVKTVSKGSPQFRRRRKKPTKSEMGMKAYGRRDEGINHGNRNTEMGVP